MRITTPNLPFYRATQSKSGLKRKARTVKCKACKVLHRIYYAKYQTYIAAETKNKEDLINPLYFLLL